LRKVKAFYKFRRALIKRFTVKNTLRAKTKKMRKSITVTNDFSSTMGQEGEYAIADEKTFRILNGVLKTGSIIIDEVT
jgi:hypothetical protein